MKAADFRLGKNEREELIRTHKLIGNKKHADRIKAMLLFDEGYTKTEISKILLIDRGSIDIWIFQYKRFGLSKLITDEYTGYSGRLTEDEKDALTNDLQEHLFSTAKEVCEHVKKRFGYEYKAESMVKLLHRMGFVYKKTKGVPGKADERKQKKFVKEYEELRRHLKKDEKIFFLDAMHPVHNNTPDYAWIKKGEEREVKTNSSRDRLNINGLYSPGDQETVIRAEETINSQATLALLRSVEAKHPELKKIYIIHDNARYYHSKYLKEHLPAKIIMIPLPPYSPNLNLIERLWKFFRKEMMSNRYHETFDEFSNATAQFFRSLRFQKAKLKSLMAENFHIFNTA